MSRVQSVVGAFGEFDNIVEIEPCIMRLHCKLEGGSFVDELALKTTGAYDIIKSGDTVQIMAGLNVDTIAEDIEDLR